MKKEDEKNTEIIKTCRERISEVYAGQRTSNGVAHIKVEAMKVMN